MSVRGSVWGFVALLALGGAAIATTGARRGAVEIESIDFGVVRTAVSPAFDATAPALSGT